MSPSSQKSLDSSTIIKFDALDDKISHEINIIYSPVLNVASTYLIDYLVQSCMQNVMSVPFKVKVCVHVLNETNNTLQTPLAMRKKAKRSFHIGLMQIMWLLLRTRHGCMMTENINGFLA